MPKHNNKEWLHDLVAVLLFVAIIVIWLFVAPGLVDEITVEGHL